MVIWTGTRRRHGHLGRRRRARVRHQHRTHAAAHADSAAGAATPLTTLDAARGDTLHLLPQALPGGRACSSPLPPARRGTSRGRPSGREPRARHAGTNGRYLATPTRWSNVRDGTLFGQRFAWRPAPSRAPPCRSPSTASSTPTTPWATSTPRPAARSRICRPARCGPLRRLVWFDRSGRRDAGSGRPAALPSRLSLSPDGTQRVSDSDRGTPMSGSSIPPAAPRCPASRPRRPSTPRRSGRPMAAGSRSARSEKARGSSGGMRWQPGRLNSSRPLTARSTARLRGHPTAARSCSRCSAAIATRRWRASRRPSAPCASCSTANIPQSEPHLSPDEPLAGVPVRRVGAAGGLRPAVPGARPPGAGRCRPAADCRRAGAPRATSCSS